MGNGSAYDIERVEGNGIEDVAVLEGIGKFGGTVLFVEGKVG